MDKATRMLTMRSNRLLGAQLVEQNLVKIEDLEVANERLLELVGEAEPRRVTVLGVLVYELKVLNEDQLLQYLVEQRHVSLVDLSVQEVPDPVNVGLDLGACWATWTVPFDAEAGFHCLATAYALSPAVKKYWEDHYDAPILWYAATLESIADHLEVLAGQRPDPHIV